MRIRRALLAAALLVGAAASPARAAVDTEVGIADDAQILYQGPAAAERAVTAWKAMGIDTVRIHARWVAVVPRPLDRTMPASFHPRDDTDPDYNWTALDNAVRLLADAGIRPVLAITGSGPVWSSRRPALDNPRYYPSPRKFGDFAHAVASRYKGRVTRYLIWNEPNQAGWLQPQFHCDARRQCTPVSPHVYRDLFRAGAAAVRGVDPSAEVPAGTLAPRGQAPRSDNAAMRPLQFIRALGCVKRDYRRDRSGPCATARPIRASAFAYHPHPVHFSPVQHDPERDNAAFGDLGRLEDVLDRTVAGGGILLPQKGRRFDLQLTEFGYQTSPPDPISGVTLTQQADWIQWAAYLAWRDPRIRNITQYEWVDEPTKVASKTGALFAGWQSGLLTATRRPKPLAAAFPNPFHVEALSRRRALFWGQVRPGGATRIRLEEKIAGSWAELTRISTNDRGYWTTEREVPIAARYRFSYEGPDGHVVSSLPARVTPHP